MNERFTAEVSAVQVESAAAGRYTFRGVASTIGNVDRAGRVFLLGAFGSKPIKVPLLFQHDQAQAIGSSVLTPKGNQLLHESSLNPRVAKSAEIQALIEDGDIMSTSISWLGDHYYGWSQLRREAPDLSKQAASMGVPQRDDIMYCSRAQIVENSVVPIPANERALIEMRAMMESKLEVASLANNRAKPQTFSLGDITGQLEKAAGARHSTADQGLVQAAHDALMNLGAVCPLPPGAEALDSDADDSAIPQPDMTGLRGRWADDIRTPENAAASKYAMADGSYPISSCSDVSDAAKLAHNSKTYTFSEVKAHVLKAKAALGCGDDILPSTWEGAAAPLSVLNGMDTQNVLPSPIDVLDRELAKLEAELPGRTNSPDKET